MVSSAAFSSPVLCRPTSPRDTESASFWPISWIISPNASHLVCIRFNYCPELVMTAARAGRLEGETEGHQVGRVRM